MVLVDTSVWTLALRRSPRQLSAHERVIVANLVELVREGLAVLIGPVRQELLSGIREEAVFEDLKQHLAAFRDESIITEEYELAAQCHNRCRTAGVSASSVDALICAVALRRGYEIFTTDNDFLRYSEVLEVRLQTV